MIALVRRGRMMLRYVLVGIAMVVMIAGAVSDATAGWFAGGSLGLSRTWNYEVGGPIDRTDETDMAERAFGGYTFIKYFGVATSYVDLGEMTADGPAFGGFTDVLKSKGMDFSAVGILPVHERVGLFGTMGLFRWVQDVHYKDSSGTYDYTDRGTSLSYGAGANLDLTPAHALGLHMEWQRFTNVGDNKNSGHKYDRSFYSLGLLYRFPK